jgi:signal peptidase II
MRAAATRGRTTVRNLAGDHVVHCGVGKSGLRFDSLSDQTMTHKGRFFWPLLLTLFVTDCTTKDLAVEHLDPAPVTQPIVDSFVRLTLVHNPGTAFGFDLRPYIGAWARPFLVLTMLAMFGVLVRLYWMTAPRARLAAAGLGLAAGGAVGNLVDRLRYPLGVVDFIDVGVGAHRFWIFNVADAGITIGAVLLAILLLREGDAALSQKAI